MTLDLALKWCKHVEYYKLAILPIENSFRCVYSLKEEKLSPFPTFRKNPHLSLS